MQHVHYVLAVLQPLLQPYTSQTLTLIITITLRFPLVGSIFVYTTVKIRSHQMTIKIPPEIVICYS